MYANNFTLKGKKKMTNTSRTLSIHYVGTLEDGTVFDSSRERGEPMTVTTGAGQLIAGFDNALTTMEEGWWLVCGPSVLGWHIGKQRWGGTSQTQCPLWTV